MSRKKSEENLPQLYAIEFQNNRNTKTFEKLYLQTKGILYNFAKKFINEQDVVDDIVANVYVTIWDKIHLFKPEFTFVSWSYILIKNECLWVINKNKKHPILSIDINDDDENSSSSTWEKHNFEKPSWEFDARESYRNREDALVDKLFELLDSAPELWKDYLIERHLGNLTMQELAEKFNVCENTAKTRLRHGRIWIREEWEKITGEKFQYETD